MTGGMTPEQFIADIKQRPVADARNRLLANEALFALLQAHKPNGGKPVVISNEEDELISHTRGYGKNDQRPEDYLDAFSQYVTTNMNEIAALKIICTRPKDLTRASLKNLKLALDREGFTTQQLNTAISELTNEEMAADIIKVTSIPNLTLEIIGDCPIPLAPTAEQQRIVDRIEYLFTKLDEAKEKAQSVLDSFETRKAAILHKAFTGELTAKWRAGQGETMDSWKQMSVESLCNSLKYGTAKKSQQDGNVVVIRMGNLQNGEIDWSDLAYSDDEEDIKKYRLVPGDVLFNRTNSPALVGKTSIYRGEYPAIYAGYLIKLDYDRSCITGDYLNYALNTTNAKEYCNAVKTDGVNQSNINAKKIGAYEFLVPTLEEQKEIARFANTIPLS